MRTALDSNILSALWSKETEAGRIAAQLGTLYAQGGLVVCAPVYAELLAHPAVDQHFVDKFLADTGVVVDFDLREEVWRAAAEGFVAYAHRRRASGGSSPRRLLVDFLVGAHAVLRADRLMTLDGGRYELDFPQLRVI